MRRALWFVIAVILLGCSRPLTTGVSVEDAFEAYVPPDALALLSIRFDELKASELYKKHAKDLDLPEVNSLARRYGLDPRRDVNALLVTWDGKEPVLLAKGAFSRDARTKIGSSVTFMGDDLAIGGKPPKGEGSIPTELEARMKIVPRNAQIWVVSRGGIPLASFPMRSDIQSILSNFAGAIKDTSVGLYLDSGAHLQAEFVCVSSQGAQRVHDTLRGLVGLARLSANSSDMDLLRLWDAVHVDQTDAVVHVRADLSADLTEKLFTYLPNLQGRTRQMLNR